uniref:Uncharacterized protein n=1 Tax=Quercus lobata TaxID=97700 RepID=A0A7N2R9G5_QUELO
MSNSSSKWRCVQKSWSILAQNPTFIAKHLRHHQTKTKNPSILVESRDKKENLKYLLQSHPDEGGGVRIVDFKGDNRGRLITVRELTNMFACINGIICIAGIFRGHYGFVLWNPAIRKDMFFPNKTLDVFNDCLACIVYGINEYIDIWVMLEYGVEDSWTKQLVVGHLLGIQRPLQLLGNEEILPVDENKTLVLYNIGSQEIKILQRTGYPKIFMPTQAIVYVESCFIHWWKCV